MNRDIWFPTAIWWDNIDIDNEILKNKSLQYEKTYPKRVVSNAGGWQSENLPEDIDYTNLIQKINFKISDVIQEYSLKTNLRLVNYWLNINRKGNYNRKHIHPRCFLSAVYYISVPNNEGKIKFHDPRVGRLSCEDPDMFGSCDLTYDTVVYTPEEGKLLVFPSWLEHEVEEYTLNEPRISIALNYTLE